MTYRHCAMLLVGVGWLVFWVYWLISASSAKKAIHKSRKHLVWPRLLFFALAVLEVRRSIVHGGRFSNTAFAFQSPLAVSAGLIVFLAGLALAIWARVYLGKNWGIPMSRNAEPELVTSGPYRLVRHPIYTGVLCAALGTTLVVSLYWIVVLLVAGFYFIYSAMQEEKYMTRQFPERYPEYKKTTKMLLPWIF